MRKTKANETPNASSKEKTKKNNSRLRRKKPLLFLYIPFWLLILGMFSGLIIMQMSRLEDYRYQLDRLQDILAAEEQAELDLRYRQAYYESDAYFELLAREMLNFVRRDEIIFQNIAE